MDNENSLNITDILNNQSLAVSEVADSSLLTIESHLIENLQKTQQELTILAGKPVQVEAVSKPVNASVEPKDDASFINPSILTQYDSATVQKVQAIANNPDSSTKLSNEQKQIIAQFYGI